jgi:hypothetical protein
MQMPKIKTPDWMNAKIHKKYSLFRYKCPLRFYRTENPSKGFALVELVFSVLLLGIMVVSVAGIYCSTLQALHAEKGVLPLDIRLRGRLEEVVSRSFDAIVDGSDTVTIDGKRHTITWKVTHPDLDGDTISDPLVKEVTVTTGGRSLSTLVVDSESLVDKI